MSNIEEDIMSEEAFNELIDNFEIVNTLTEYGRKAIKQNVKKLQKRIKELEEQVKILDEAYTGVIKESKKWFDIAHSSIPKQKVKDVIKNIKEKIEKSKKHKEDNWVVDYIGAEYLLDKIEKRLLEDK